MAWAGQVSTTDVQRAVGVVKEVLEEIGLKPLPLPEVNDKLDQMTDFRVGVPVRFSSVGRG